MQIIPLCPQCRSPHTRPLSQADGTTAGPDVRCLICLWKGQPTQWIHSSLEGEDEQPEFYIAGKRIMRTDLLEIREG